MMSKDKGKTVAVISFSDGRSVSMDIESVNGITIGAPLEVSPGQWFCEMIVRTDNGMLSLQMLSDSADRFQPIYQQN